VALCEWKAICFGGSEGGRIYRHRGLVYRIIDAEGNKIGVPIKASSLGIKPTLENLERRFAANEISREQFRQKIKGAIDEVLKNAANLKDLIVALEKKQVYTVLRQNNEGRIYGITFVDNNTKCIFNGSDLGKQYSAGRLQSRMTSVENQSQKNAIEEKPEIGVRTRETKAITFGKQHHQLLKEKSIKDEKILEQLLAPREQFENAPFQFLKKKRKKKSKKIGYNL